MGSASVLFVAAEGPRTEALEAGLRSRSRASWPRIAPDALERETDAALATADAIVYLPSAELSSGDAPDRSEAARVLERIASTRARVVLLSSAEVYGASPRNPGFMLESRRLARDAKNAITRGFIELESLARMRLDPQRLTILRPCPWPVRGGSDSFSRLFAKGAALTLAGYDPSIQVLDPRDLAAGVALAVERGPAGCFNLAPDGSIPLRRAIALCGRGRVALPLSVQRAARALLGRFDGSASIDQLEFIRYSFTVSNRASRRTLGFAPERSSEEALYALCAEARPAPAPRRYDEFGLDPEYVARAGRLLFGFMAERYWRIEVEGLEHVPRTGKAVLAGLHRGLVAWDAVMVMHILAQRLGRHPRFLVHPTAFQFPFVFDLTTKLGGVLACQENADYVLEHGELLGIFPEGIRGVFSLYKDAYRLRKFGRHDFVKIALRNQSKIVPFVIVGSAETYPILGKLDWRWLQRKTEWPFVPLTPTLFPLMPAPLPSKWILRFLAPVELGGHPPEAARDSLLVRTISDAIKQDMQVAIDELLARRRSLFSG